MTEQGDDARPAVLVVDDTDANLVALEAVLASIECDVVSVRSGNDALRALLHREFAVVLLDVQMPEMDGYEVARISRADPTTKDIPIIFVTAATSSLENELRGYGEGAVDYIFKPVNAFVLRSKVRVFVELYANRKKLDREILAHERTLAILRHSNAALRHFTHAASHDLGAPLSAVSGFIAALEEEVGDALDVPARHYLDRAKNGAVRMRDLLDALLAFAGLSRPAAEEDVDCDAVMRAVEEDLRARIEAASATLVVGPLPVVRGDRSRVYQLFLNLVANALKYRRAEAAPRAEVYVEDRADGVTFCVQDQGIGVDPEHHARIFEAFSRLHTANRFDGTGLGLAICREIVEQHGGRIWVESKLGEGARFCFRLGSVAPSSAPGP